MEEGHEDDMVGRVGRCCVCVREGKERAGVCVTVPAGLLRTGMQWMG